MNIKLGKGIKESIIRFDQDISNEQVETLSNIFNDKNLLREVIETLIQFDGEDAPGWQQLAEAACAPQQRMADGGKRARERVLVLADVAHERRVVA